jgi:PPE-repeat protein
MDAQSGASSVVKKKATEPDVAATPAAAVATGEQAQRRRRRRAMVKQLGRGYEYMDLDSDTEPDASMGDGRVASAEASEHGAGTIGMTGTAHRAGAGPAAGLITLADEAFGSGPRMPLLPGTWSTGSVPRADPREGEDNP